MESPLFSGAATALITPFRDGALDFYALELLLSRQAEAGISAVVLAGSTGEAATLSRTEWLELLRFGRDHLPSSLPVIAGIGGNNTEDCAEKAREAESLGCDGVLLTPPYCNKGNRDGILRHFLYTADHSGLPMIIYNVPGRTGIPMDAEMYLRLSEQPNICGVKEASGSISLASQTLALCNDGFSVWSGNDGDTFPLMVLGAEGVISVASNVVPEEMIRLCDLCRACRFKEARKLHYGLEPLFSALFSDVNPIPVKTALSHMGLCRSELRLPLSEMNEFKEKALLSVLNHYTQ